MIVCVCHRVSDRHIACSVEEGCSSFEELQDALGVGTRCGSCREHARCAFELHASMQRSAPGGAETGTIHIAVERSETVFARAA